MKVRLLNIDFLYALDKTGVSISSSNLEKIANLSTAVRQFEGNTAPVTITGAIDFFQEDFERNQTNTQLYYSVNWDCFRDCKIIMPAFLGKREEKYKEYNEIEQLTSKSKIIILDRAEELVQIAGLPDIIGSSDEKFKRTIVKKLMPYLEKADKEVDGCCSDYYRIVGKGKAAIPVKV